MMGQSLTALPHIELYFTTFFVLFYGIFHVNVFLYSLCNSTKIDHYLAFHLGDVTDESYL